MRKIIGGIILLLVLFAIFNVFGSRRGYRREGLVSTFTHSAVRGAGNYTGYKVAKHFWDKSSHKKYAYQ